MQKNNFSPECEPNYYMVIDQCLLGKLFSNQVTIHILHVYFCNNTYIKGLKLDRGSCIYIVDKHSTQLVLFCFVKKSVDIFNMTPMSLSYCSGLYF